MMASMVYTAQEMRKKIKVLRGGLGGGVITMPSQESSREVADMLRQAAEMRERCEELKAQCLKICGREACDHNGDKCVCCARDVIDFIVRGDNDAGKPDISVSQMAI